MAPKGKDRSSQLAQSFPKSPSKETKSPEEITRKDGKTKKLLEENAGVVLEHLDEVVERAVDRVIGRHLQRALDELKDSLETRFQKLEATCRDLLQKLELQEGERHAEMVSLNDRVCELEHVIAKREHESNLVISGLPESADEDTKTEVLKLCEEVLKVDLDPNELLQAVRLGKKSMHSGSSQPTRPSSRPRAVLVRTAGTKTKEKFMACRGPHLRTCGIFLNEDLSKQEQSARRALVQLYKEARKHDVRCRLDRACLVVGDKRFYDPSRAMAVIPTLISNPVARNSLENAFSKVFRSSEQ